METVVLLLGVEAYSPQTPPQVGYNGVVWFGF